MTGRFDSRSQPALPAFLYRLTAISRRELGSHLRAMVLVGSHAVGDARPDSDVDVIAVTSPGPPAGASEALAASLLEAAESCPGAGLEYVLYAASALRAPTYPLPYLLNVNGGPRRERHVSTGGDPPHWFLLDVAMAHQHALSLYGPTVRDLGAEPARALVARAILDALDWHYEHESVSANTVLNACRSRCWLETGGWRSKSGAARWLAARRLPADEAAVVAAALEAREGGGALDPEAVRAFVASTAEAARDVLRSSTDEPDGPSAHAPERAP